jgi:hypothetical protein
MVNTAKPDRRRFTRVNFHAEVTLTQQNYGFSSTLVDVSLNGILLDTPAEYELRADSPADVAIKLGDETEINMSVRLVHSSSDVLGFRCESIDVDSIGHLRRLIELNIGDAHAAERVLSELMRPRNLSAQI